MAETLDIGDRAGRDVKKNSDNQQSVGGDDMSGGAFWLLLGMALALLVLLVIVLALLDFVRRMAGAVHDENARDVAHEVKKRTRTGINPIRRFGGIVGDLVIKSHDLSA